MASTKPGLLLLIDDLSPQALDEFHRQLDGVYEVHAVNPSPGFAADLQGKALQATSILVKGGIVPVTQADMARLPNLRLVCCLGAGFERVDTAAAQARGIAVTNGSGANSACVADHAMGLVIAVMRRFRAADEAAREGRWHHGFERIAQVSGKTMGIAGLGRIGIELAARATAFRMSVLYHNRQPRSDVPWEYVPGLEELARRADVLVCVLPGGKGTRHAIDARVLRALGPQGYLVNVGRGSAVNTADLVQALAARGIAGAGLDVLESEPHVPPALVALPDVLITPHIGGKSPESTAGTLQLAIDNLLAQVRGQALVNRVA